MSDITGEGWGSQHDWVRGDTIQSKDRFERGTLYVCGYCGSKFRHFYHETPDIFDSMKYSGVPEFCEIDEAVK